MILSIYGYEVVNVVNSHTLLESATEKGGNAVPSVSYVHIS